MAKNQCHIPRFTSYWNHASIKRSPEACGCGDASEPVRARSPMPRRRSPGRPTECASGRGGCRNSVALQGFLRRSGLSTGGSRRRQTLCLPSGHHPSPPLTADARCTRVRGSSLASPNRPLHESLARRSSALRCKPRFDLAGALPTSQAARLPRIGAPCVRLDSSLAFSSLSVLILARLLHTCVIRQLVPIDRLQRASHAKAFLRLRLL